MLIRGKPVGTVLANDIIFLLDNQVGESATLEYKQELPGDNSEAKKEFLADVSAMANNMGGVIVYGIAEQREDGKTTGRPTRPIAGIGQTNRDLLERQFRERIQLSKARCRKISSRR
jgi:predicted HTH transcriptional regulator